MVPALHFTLNPPPPPLLPPPSLRPSESGSPLIEAIKARNEKDVEILAPTCSKDEINAEIELGNRPIHLAAAKGKSPVVDTKF